MNYRLFILIPILIVGFYSCKKEKEEPPVATSDPYATEKTQVKETYANIAFAIYEDSYIKALNLQVACQNFVSNPTASTHQAAKQAWLDAREVYGKSEIFRFVEGPIDNSSDGPEGMINAWPLDEAYIDYVDLAPNSGIINNTSGYPTIDMTSLIGANEFGGEENISLGFHAIEFLLWGQDFYSGSSGLRPYTDFVTDGSGTAQNQVRRGQYLLVCCDVLILSLNQVKNAWATTGTTYRTEWLNMNNTTALRKIFNSIRVMSGFELSGERIYTAYDNQNQEDEHSCFSDNTHRDIALNAAGIGMLYKGEYTRIDGTIVSGYALEDLVPLKNSAKNTEFLDLRAQTDYKISLMYTPFDQAIILPAERPKVLDVVLSLQSEETKILEIAQLFGIVF